MKGLFFILFLQTFCLANIYSFISTLKPQTPIPNNLFCLWLKMALNALKVRVPAILASELGFLGSPSCIHVTKLLFDFLLLICLVNLILRPLRRT